MDASAADEQMSYAAQIFPLWGRLQGTHHLHGNHGAEVYDGRQSALCHGMAAGLYTVEIQSSLQGAYHHHFSCYIVKGQAQQGVVSLLQSQEIAGEAGACPHAFFFYTNGLWRSGGTAGMNRQVLIFRVPFLQKIVKRCYWCHISCPLIHRGISMLSV